MRPSSVRLAGRIHGGVSQGRLTVPRHLMSISDLTSTELTKLVLNAAAHKKAVKSTGIPKHLNSLLTGRTVAMMFSKLSTRTRVSTEAAVAMMGGHPMFLGKNDIQLGVNESLQDTSRVISSMTSCMVARVGPHSDVANLAKYSSVPVINALSSDFHPLQIIADLLTIHEHIPKASTDSEIVPNNLKVAWVGDANNVLYDLAIACMKLGVQISVATPPGYGIPQDMVDLITSQTNSSGQSGTLKQTFVPEEAVLDADIIVTDTWVSMGQEEETQKRLRDFAGFQVSDDLAKRGGAKKNWRFMHCLPRHPEEVDDDVFYSGRSLVFPEAENRLWAAVAALEGFVVHEGNIRLN
ncbi:ornithine carbamoyltransferase precursor-like protein [Hypoxylon sp. NC1633]|nr:ornithine carbamoyltransferase precursor-like protein [Hypoxylon sp. NC1633]